MKPALMSEAGACRVVASSAYMLDAVTLTTGGNVLRPARKSP